MDDLYCFDTIPGTPAWYYKRFPGFYNIQCYKILAQWEAGVQTDEQFNEDQEENKENSPPLNKKRSIESEEQESLVDNACDSSL